MAIFIAYPWMAAAIGVLFVVLAWGRPRRLLLSAGVVWILYSVYETAMQQRWLCTGECNIRVDLIFIYPLLLLLTAAAAFSSIRASQPKRPNEMNE
jgi:hypothetical protein